jgi:hypothetical protein
MLGSKNKSWLMEDNDSNLKKEVESLRRKLEFERFNRANQEKTLRLEEQLKALEKRLDDGLAHAKQSSTRVYATISVIFAVLGFIGWTSINSAINSKVKDEFERNNYETKISQLVDSTEKKISLLNSEVEKLNKDAHAIFDQFRASTDKQLVLVQSYTESLIQVNPNIASIDGAQKAGLKLTPVFGITPRVTTRGEIKKLLKDKELSMFGYKKKSSNPTLYSFEYGEINFTGKETDSYANTYDTVSYIEYWGNDKLPLGFSTKTKLEVASEIAKNNFHWLGYQSFRGLVYSNKPKGPILLEISYQPKKGNNLIFSIYGPI